MPAVTFTTLAQPNPGDVLLIEVPERVVRALGERKRPPLVATLNGVTYRTTIAVYGDGYYIPVRREIRDAAKLAPRVRAKVWLELDEKPRAVEVPPNLARALARDRTAKTAFEGFSYTHQREYVEWITQAKREETRAGRVVKTLAALRAGKKGAR